MLTRCRGFLAARIEAFLGSPFGCLARLFVVRMFKGGSDAVGEDLNLGLGAILIVLAMPGLLVSLLMFEKYGSFIRWLSGRLSVDPLAEVVPDEYFFLVLSVVVTGAAAVWRWDAIFPDSRDHSNLVPLPIALRTQFLANFLATALFVVLLSLFTNLASMVLFPVAVFGSQKSFELLGRFALGHALTVTLASAFGFFFVFGLAGLLMSFLPPLAFRRASLLVRFALNSCFLVLLLSCLAVPDWLAHMPIQRAHRLALIPPISFLGLARSIWGSRDPFVSVMAKAALTSVAGGALVAAIANVLSFRRAFLRIPEIAGVAPLPRQRWSFSLFSPFHKMILRSQSQHACYRFVARTLLRTEVHQQILLGFAALALVLAAQALGSSGNLHSMVLAPVPPADLLSIPFLLSYCLIAGIRFAFEIPADLRANWIFQLWLDPKGEDAREVARCVLVTSSTMWPAPFLFLFTLVHWGWLPALVHTAIWTSCNVLLIEILLLRFRKIPCTCGYPAFQSHSGLILVAYIFSFLVFTGLLPDLDRWCLTNPLQLVWLGPLFATVFAALRKYRKEMLAMDKQLIFEEEPRGF